MQHKCNRNCVCTIELDKAAAALNLASNLLLVSIWSGSDDLIEGAYAAVRGAKAKVSGALLMYRDHRCEALAEHAA